MMAAQNAGAARNRELTVKRGSLKRNYSEQKENGNVSTGLKGNLLQLLNNNDFTEEAGVSSDDDCDNNEDGEEVESLQLTKESLNADDEDTEEEKEEEEEEEEEPPKTLPKRKRLVFESWNSCKRDNYCRLAAAGKRSVHSPPIPTRKLIKVDKEQRKDDEQRPLPTLLKQVLVSYPASGAHYSLIMGRDLLSLGGGGGGGSNPFPPLGGALLRFGLHYILQQRVQTGDCAALRSSVVLFDSATFGTIDRYPKLSEAEKRKFRQHHRLGDKEYLVFLVRMSDPAFSAAAAAVNKKGKKRGKKVYDEEEDEDDDEDDEDDDDEVDEYIFSDELEWARREHAEVGVKTGGGDRELEENRRWHWYLVIVTDITAYQGPPVSDRSAIYSTILFLDPNPCLGAPHYRWASAGVRSYLRDIYLDLHGLDTGVRLNYRYPNLAQSISVLSGGGGGGNAANPNGARTQHQPKTNSSLLKNLKNLKVDTNNSSSGGTSGTGNTPRQSKANSGLLLLAYFEAFMCQELFRRKVIKGLPLGQLNIFPHNSPTFDAARARHSWRVALFSVIDFTLINRERLLRQLNWTEEMVKEEKQQKEEQREQQEKTARKR